MSIRKRAYTGNMYLRNNTFTHASDNLVGTGSLRAGADKIHHNLQLVCRCLDVVRDCMR